MSQCNCKEPVVIKFAKISPKAIIPTKRDEDAGYDIYPCFDEDYILIPPHHTIMIPSGIASVLPQDYYFALEERGSTGSKGIAQRCGIIDSGYRGEWFIPLTNTTTNTICITNLNKQKLIDSINNKHVGNNQIFSKMLIIYNKLKYKRLIIYPSNKAICQAILSSVIKAETKVLLYKDLLKIESDRGINKMGSSGK